MKSMFRQLEIGEQFISSGVVWVKRSTRTARIAGTSNDWFYFAQDEVVQRIR